MGRGRLQLVVVLGGLAARAAAGGAAVLVELRGWLVGWVGGDGSD
jgi:hypothetical protein